MQTSSKTSSEAHLLWLSGERAGVCARVPASVRCQTRRYCTHNLCLMHATGTLQLVHGREVDVLYEVDHWRGPLGQHILVVVTNRGSARNFCVMITSIAMPSAEHWRPLFPHSRARKVRTSRFGRRARPCARPATALLGDFAQIDSVHAARDFWAVLGREHGFEQVWMLHGTDVAAAVEDVLAARPVRAPLLCRYVTSYEAYSKNA